MDYQIRFGNFLVIDSIDSIDWINWSGNFFERNCAQSLGGSHIIMGITYEVATQE